MSKHKDQAGATNHQSGDVGITLGPPVVVAQAPESVKGWGPYQFPRVERLADGSIHVAYHIEADSAKAYGLSMGHAVSNDDGQTWRAVDDLPAPGGLALPSGERLLADSARSVPIEDLSLPKPLASVHASYVDYDYYPPDVMPAGHAPAWPFQRFSPGAGWRAEAARVTFTQAASVRYVTEGVMVCPFFEQDRIRLLPGGKLLATLYGVPHLGRRNRVIRPFLTTVVQSDDGGRNWREVGAIPYVGDPDADPHFDSRDGFSEPELQPMPDGSLLCLLRTADGNGNGPMYVSRSRDAGVTWDRPRVFDDRGVWPQLLSLDSGVTLTSYGRPGLFVRATRDPAGERWGPRVTVREPSSLEAPNTCSYSDLLSLGPRRALLIYSDFLHPNKAGKPCKSMLARTVDVTV